MILYVKCSNDRRPELSVRTELLEEAGERQIRKVPACKAAEAHIAALRQYGSALEQLFAGTRLSVNVCTREGTSAVFPYIAGETLEQEADALLPDAHALHDFFEQYFLLLESACDSHFDNGEEYQAVFGDGARFLGEKAFSVSDIDLLLGNIMVEGEKWHIIDYEWTFPFPVPFSYIRWRILHYYFVSSQVRMQLYPEGFDKAFGIGESTALVYEEMEKRFQCYVDGSHVQLRKLYQLISPGIEEVGKSSVSQAELAELRKKAEDLSYFRETAEETVRLLHERQRVMEAMAVTRPMRAYRKLKRARGGDPFAQLHPQIAKVETGLCCAVDELLIREGQCKVTGWCFDRTFPVQKIALTDKDGRELPAKLTRRYRPDVTETFRLDPNEKPGFVLLVDTSLLDKRPIALEIHNLRGYLREELDLDSAFSHQEMRYHEWARRHEKSAEDLAAERVRTFSPAPLFSVVVPLYRTKGTFLRELYDSIAAQTYGNWELILSDGSGEDSPLTEILDDLGKDTRVKLLRHKERLQISENTNAAMQAAKGDFIVFCDHDDLLTPDALYEFAAALEEQADSALLYSDEDKILDGGLLTEPHFKPDFNLDYLLTNNYICHLLAVRRALCERVGGLNPAYDGAQDHEFILRCVAESEKIVHVPRVLYHWRVSDSSTAGDLSVKPYAREAARRAIESFYQKKNWPATVLPGEVYGYWRTDWQWPDKPLVSVIIPNKDAREKLQRCVTSLYENNRYSNIEVLIAENNSEQPETFALYDELERKYNRLRVIRYDLPFNYSAINNAAAREAKGSFLLFLNNDTEILEPESLENMLGFGMRDDVGAVGARLLYADGSIQHAGVMIGVDGIAGHVFRGTKRGEPGYGKRIVCAQDLSAVTAACLLVRRDVFARIGGFSEELAVAFNDIDLCLRIGAEGLRVVYEPAAVLLHDESYSRGAEDSSEKWARFKEEIRIFKNRWGKQLADGDPFYSPNFSRRLPGYILTTEEEETEDAAKRAAQVKGQESV